MSTALLPFTTNEIKAIIGHTAADDCVMANHEIALSPVRNKDKSPTVEHVWWWHVPGRGSISVHLHTVDGALPDGDCSLYFFRAEDISVLVRGESEDAPIQLCTTSDNLQLWSFRYPVGCPRQVEGLSIAITA